MLTIKKIAVATATVGLLVSPLAASATTVSATASVDATASTGATTNPDNFCVKINDTASTINTMLTKLQSDRGSIRSKMLSAFSARVNARAASIEQIRTTQKRNFTADIAKLNAKATTDAEKAAVATFQTTVTADEATREATITVAVNAYQTGAQSIITGRENTVSTAATTFQAAVTAAIAQAKTDCSNGVKPATARQTMMASIRSANDAFRTSVTGLADGSIIALASVREKAILAANQAFQTAVQAAEVTVKAAFATSASASTSTSTTTTTP